MNYLQNIKVAESWNLRVLEIVSLEGTFSPIFLSRLLCAKHSSKFFDMYYLFQSSYYHLHFTNEEIKTWKA